MRKFWQMEAGSYKIDPASLHTSLVEEGYFTFKPAKVSGLIYIQIKDNRIDQVNRDDIREKCWVYVNETHEFESADEKAQIKKEILKSRVLFSRDLLNLLPRAELNEIKDTEDRSCIFFQDCLLEVSAESIVKKNYGEVEGQVWEKDILQFDLKWDVSDEIEPTGEFFELFKDITKHPNTRIEDQNRDSLLTILGYLLHRYKDPSNPKAVILMDTYIDGNPQGGTGKSLIVDALSKIRSVAKVDGKFYNPSKSFNFSDVRFGTRVLAFDDIPKNFSFEMLFPLISGDAVIERKWENKFSISYSSSPKILLTTNYTIEGRGSSHKRRKVEFILSATYNDEYMPIDRFGHRLFEEWDDKEWKNFYLFMIHCLQMFLLMGIVEPNVNVAERIMKQMATQEFIDYV